ncbi:uncharacterized protein LOC129582386 [Paramacrobiotus metropolitanus]|uniref:uncharacterized protein LOC129582386 n=1 Tax=Paramacrobiotus metropolitanus TaxID=2943436 RepID=UPI002445CB5A|nr:uncharacterized protein LOC129582386 [Paramacrobiotus metropolitanus]
MPANKILLKLELECYMYTMLAHFTIYFLGLSTMLLLCLPFSHSQDDYPDPEFPDLYSPAVRFTVIPENFTGRIGCDSGRCVLEIYDAHFRELCNDTFEHCLGMCLQSSDATAPVRQSCAAQSRSQCQIAVSSAWFGNPCPGRLKHLVVSYSCSCAMPVNSGSGPVENGQGAGFSVAAMASPLGPTELKPRGKDCDRRIFRTLCT